MYLLLIWLHFIGDFIMQSDETALKKSEDNFILFLHSLLYGVFFIPFGYPYFIINIIAHFCIDYCTSRINKGLYNNRHWFFVCIGFDQALHLSVLFLTMEAIC